jgi:hypothetical protein
MGPSCRNSDVDTPGRCAYDGQAMKNEQRMDEEPPFPRWELVLMYHDRNGSLAKKTILSPESIEFAKVNILHYVVDEAFKDITKKRLGL